MTYYDDLDNEINSLYQKDLNRNDYLDKSFGDEENDENNGNNENFYKNFIGTELNDIFYEKHNSEKLDSLYLSKEEDILNIDENKKNILNIIQTETKTKPKLGRKTKNCTETGIHTKYKEDNMLRKIKVILKKSFMDFINTKMEEIFKKDSKIIIDGKEYKIKLLNLRQDIVKNINVEFNKKLLNERIKDFFNYKISTSFRNYPVNFNELLMDKLYEIENGEKITCILEKTFIECLRYFRMDEEIFRDPEYSCLKGLEKGFLSLKQNLSKNYDEEYIEKLIQLIKNFEKVFEDKKGREPRTSKSNIY